MGSVSAISRTATAADPSGSLDDATKQYVDAADALAEKTSHRAAASGYPSLDANTRIPSAQMPFVTSPIRSGSVSSSVTSDASTGSGNFVNLTVTGDATINAPTNPTDWQTFEWHLLASGAARNITFAGGFVQGGVGLGPYAVPRGAVLIAKAHYVGNRTNSSDVAAAAWALVSVTITDQAFPLAAIGALSASDASVTNARTPTSHASSHNQGGSDEIGLVAPLAKTANYTLTNSDRTVIFDTTTGALTATLPTPVGRSGRRFTIKKLSSAGTIPNQLTVATAAGLIDGASTEIIQVAGGFREFESDGTNWHIVGGKVEPVIVALTSVGAGGTISIDASIGSVYRVTASGATVTLGVPTNAIDGDQIMVEVLCSVTCTITINASILLAGGAGSSIAMASGKRWFGALRYVTSVGWFLIGSAAQA